LVTNKIKFTNTNIGSSESSDNKIGLSCHLYTDAWKGFYVT